MTTLEELQKSKALFCMNFKITILSSEKSAYVLYLYVSIRTLFLKGVLIWERIGKEKSWE